MHREKIELFTSDDGYDRPLSGRVSGFPRDGMLILGILAEGGEHAFTMLFAYDTASHRTQLVDLGQRFAGVLAKKCAASFEIVSTANNGGIVMKLESASHCAPEGRCLLRPTGSAVERLQEGASIVTLYEYSSK